MIDMEIENYALKCMKDYTRHVASSRVLPHIDGLKNVQRRVLFSLLNIGARPNKGFRKTSTVIGQCMLYHPHGEASINGAIHSLISSPNPLIAGRGNWGSVLNDPISAPRYNECRTSEIFEALFDFSCLKIGHFEKNYDESTDELTLFQTKIPLNYLIGVSGIGVGFTVNTPSYYIKSIKDLIINKLSNKSIKVLDYGYGSIYNTNTERVEPRLEKIKFNGEEYIEIKEIPVSATLGVINQDKFITELRLSGQIEIIVDISPSNFGIKIKAPENVIDYIINKSSISPRVQEMYYHKRVRTTGFIDEWIKYRHDYVKRKIYYDNVNVFHKSLTDEAINEISKIGLGGSNFIDTVKDISKKVYDKYAVYPTEASEFSITKREFVDAILDKPLKSIVSKKVGNLNLDLISDDDVDKYMVKEIQEIDDKLFTPKSKRTKGITYKNKLKIVRYVVIKQNSLMVSFIRTPRVLNYEVGGQIYAFYEDCTYELIPDKFTGEYISEKPIVGFVEYGVSSFIHTITDKLCVYKRFGYIKEPVKFIAPAKKVMIDDVEYNVEDGLSFDKYNRYRVVS